MNTFLEKFLEKSKGLIYYKKFTFVNLYRLVNAGTNKEKENL